MDLSVYVPTWRARSVLAVTCEFLEENGLCGVIFDLDSTLRTRLAMPKRQIQEHIWHLSHSGVGLCIVTNNPHILIRRAANLLGVDYVACGVGGVPRKPHVRGFESAISDVLGTKPVQTLVVGDQLSTDVRGGNEAECPTLLVDPLPGWEWPHIQLKRRKEEKLKIAMAATGRRLPAYLEDMVSCRP